MKLLILCFCFLFLNSCGLYDFERAKSKQIIGNFYVVNLHLPEYPGYIVVFKERGGFERTLLDQNEFVDCLKANDSVILIKTKPKPEVSYLLIKHDYGKSALGFARIDEDEFTHREQNSEFKTNYDSTTLQF